MNDTALVTVVETATFLRRCQGLLVEDDRWALVDHLAASPTDGDIVPGGGGIRKLRWGTAGRGKRGGVRIVHYFADSESPVFLLDVYAKNEKSTYTAAELTMMRQLVKRLIGGYRARGLQ
jgi:hypothetical protein